MLSEIRKYSMTVLAASSCSGVKVSDGCGPDGVTDFDGREDETSEDGDSEDGDNETGLPDPDTPPSDSSHNTSIGATIPNRHLRPGIPPTLEPHTNTWRQQRETLTKS